VRLSRCLALLAAAALPMTALNAASYSEVRERIHPGEVKLQDVQLEDIVKAPTSFQNLRVRFRCMFVESGELFDREHTYFIPSGYANLIVYDDHADLSDPQVRANPLTRLFIHKDRVDASIVVSLKKYQLLDIIGEVKWVQDGEPIIEIHHILPATRPEKISDTVVYHVQQANQLANENSYALADDYYVAALDENIPDHNRAVIGLRRARNLMAWGQFEPCAVTLRQALTLTDQYVDLVDQKTLASMHYLLAKAVAETGEQAGTVERRAERFQEAIGHARLAVQLDPEQGDAYAVLGITLAGQGRYSEARRECEKAVRLRPTNAEVRWYLGRILDQEGSYEEAIEALRKAIDLTPKDHRIHKAIGAVYLHRGQKGGPKAGEDFVTALREYDIAIRLNPADPESHYGSGQVLEVASAANAEVQIGTARQVATVAMAMERYKNSVAADPKYLPVRRTLANRYRADNQPDEAIVHLKAITEIDPERLESFFELGRYQWSLDRKADALATYEQCVVLHPKSQEALAAALHVAVEAGAIDKGTAWAQQLLTIDPKHGMGTLDLARLKLASGQAKEALKLARTAEGLLEAPAAKDQAKQVQQQAEAALAAPAAPPAK
jgi:tetratricopeptide (TPR) repeat protein